MKTEVLLNGKSYQADLTQPIDCSIPIIPNEVGPNCFYAPMPEASPLRAGDFVGSLEAGAPVNFYNLKINPHGNGTHTECLGHVHPGAHYVNQYLRDFFFPALLISLYPEQQDSGDRVITVSKFKQVLGDTPLPKALILRTLPNTEDKKTRVYSGTNPPYFEPQLLSYLASKGVFHLLTDLPSVDREQDDGKLSAHKAFWKIPEAIRTEATISELLFIPDLAQDGYYLLQMNILNLQLDVSPSRPVIYKLQES
jgi:kynurenine formamidase